jgi:asparagine synthase (glutamine-hydrolysing)
MDTRTNVALLAEELSIKPTVFTAGFTEVEYDETPYAKIMAEHYGLEHIVVTMTQDMVKNVDEISALYDNPMADRAVLPEFLICNIAKSRGLKYMVTGEGGDEIMGLPRNMSEDKPFDLPADTSNTQLAQYYHGLSTLIFPEMRLELMQGVAMQESYLARMYDSFGPLSAFDKVYFGQWQTWLIDNVQMKDMQVMEQAKLQFVSPYMNKELMQFMAQLPLNDKLAGLRDKAFVRAAMGNVLPEKILNKPKHKFYVPMKEWFQGDTYGFVHDTLTTSDGFCAQQLDMPTIKRLLEEHKSGQADHNRPLWAMLFLNFWYKHKLDQVKATLQ